jgi:cell cycle arrest protein BUB3
VQLLSDDSAPLLVSVALPFKPFAMALNDDKVVVAMASRAVHIYELAALADACRSHGTGAPQPAHAIAAAAVNVELEPWQRRESSLKFMTRAVACMPNNLGYASSSIEGRVAVEWFDPSPESQTRKYAFKCHRQQQPPQRSQQQPQAAGADALEDVVYPVNALAFHPVHGTFASGGGDGVVALWDGVAKRRIKQYQRYSASVAALAFSGDGRLLAVAVCPGFEDGREDVTAEGQTKLFLRRLGENEAKAKSVK